MGMKPNEKVKKKKQKKYKQNYKYQRKNGLFLD